MDIEEELNCPMAIGRKCGETSEVTGHEVSAASQEGVCILACTFGEIGYM